MAKDKSIKKQLSSLDGWGDTPEKSFEDVEPGKYQVRIDAATINNAKSSGRLQVSWELTIVNGDSANRKLFKHDGLDTEDGRSYFRGSLARLGHEWPDEPDDLIEVLEELIGTFASVTVRKRKDSDSVNTYFDKALDSDDVEVDDELDAAEPEEAEETEAEEAEEAEETVSADEINAMTKKELKAFVKENDLECDWSDDLDDIKEAIIEELELTSEPEAEEAEAEEAEELTPDDINGMTKKELKALVKERKLDVDLTDEVEDIRIAVIEELDLLEAEPEEVSCTLGFKAKAIDKVMGKKFLKLAKAAELDPDDYEDITDMLIELAEFNGVSGEFKKPAALLKALSA